MCGESAEPVSGSWCIPRLASRWNFLENPRLPPLLASRYHRQRRENQIEPKLNELRQVQGTGLDPNGSVIPQLCVGIFLEPEQKLLRFARSDSNGTFAVDTNAGRRRR